MCTNVLDTLSCAWVPKWQRPFMCVLHTYNLPTQECYSKSNMWDNKHMTWQYSNTQKFTLFLLQREFDQVIILSVSAKGHKSMFILSRTFTSVHMCALVAIGGFPKRPLGKEGRTCLVRCAGRIWTDAPGLTLLRTGSTLHQLKKVGNTWEDVARWLCHFSMDRTVKQCFWSRELLSR